MPDEQPQPPQQKPWPLWRTIGIGCSVVSVLLVIQARLIVPSIMAQARDEARELVAEHSERPHRDVATNEDLVALVASINGLRGDMTEMLVQQGRLDEKMVSLQSEVALLRKQ